MNITIAEFGLHMGHYLENANREPVLIERNDRPLAVLVSPALFERFLAREDGVWAERALAAEKTGYAGVDGKQQLFALAEEKGVALEPYAKVRNVPESQGKNGRKSFVTTS